MLRLIHEPRLSGYFTHALKNLPGFLMSKWVFGTIVIFACSTFASIPQPPTKTDTVPELKTLTSFKEPKLKIARPDEGSLIFDLPITYNTKVQQWIHYFQKNGKRYFKKWIERSHKYIPPIQRILKERGLPNDLAYVAMIESGFSAHAVSTAEAVGPWQFIRATAERYGLKVSWWLDERKDFHKSTVAAANYIQDLYRMFRSWYLVAAGYNMGENKVKRLIDKHQTTNYWILAKKGALSDETTNYVPKLIAAMLISKAPGLYGFRELESEKPVPYEHIFVPGGTDLVGLSNHIGVNYEYMKDLNPELLHGFVPKFVQSHKIKIPKGSMKMVSTYLETRLSGKPL